MPRLPRLQIPGGIYHVTVHANIGRLVFSDDTERAHFLATLDATVGRHEWSCRSFCLLSTHFHLLVATPQPNIAAGMQYLNGRYAQWANWNRGERGHVFEGRYNAVVVESDGHAIELHRYIALNPVRAGIVRHPEDWTWSSIGAVLGKRPPPRFLDVGSALDPFGSTLVAARRRLRAFIQDGLTGDVA
jgi:putative transposase